MCKVSKGAKIRNRYNQVPHLIQDTTEWESDKLTVSKAVVAGPAGRRAPDRFLDEYAFRLVPFFLVLAHFSL